MRRRHGFSLVEVLLAIFILGIGVIAVAALFPAGIAQQRRSVDDIIGPIVANNALAILRTRLRPDDFGTFEEFGTPTPFWTVDGDWPWLRPGFFFSDRPISIAFPDIVFAGSISIFDNINVSPDALDQVTGIPWNSAIYGNADGPVIIFNQAERYYPMQTQKSSVLRPPQYVWDCMFRRYQGRILVAIFVYRVAVPGGGAVTYVVPANSSDSTVPPVPINLFIADSANSNFIGDQWNANVSIVRGTNVASTPYDASDDRQAWQEPRQWILDQNNNVHRVLSQSLAANNVMDIELVRPLAEMPDLPTNFFPAPMIDVNGNGLRDTDLISNIWYLPAEIDQPNGTYLLTPVYVTVRAL